MKTTRRWKLPCLPPISTTGGKKMSHAQMRQGYICNACSGQGAISVREEDGQHYLTVRGDGTIAREDWETEIPKWVFDQLWSSCRNFTLQKIHYSVPYGELVLEIASYLGPLSELTILEIEFANKAQAKRFDIAAIAPDAVEVTANVRYQEKSLAMYGVPKQNR